MTLRIYDDTTHQAVPKDPSEPMENAYIKSVPYNSEFAADREDAYHAYAAMLAAAPPYGAALPTREEIARIMKQYVGFEDDSGEQVLVGTTQAADAILATLAECVKVMRRCR